MAARKSIHRLAVLVLGLFAAVASAQTAPNEWTWMGGSKTLGAGSSVPGVYGTPGTPAAANIPGGRYLPATWTDGNGNFWLFGGKGSDANNTIGYLNDLWEFNPSANEWAWVGGSNTVPSCSPIPQILCGQPGVYGTLGTAAAGNNPGARYGAATWTDKSGNLWLFGGVALDSAGNGNDLNDLWEFNPSTKEWAWMGGSNTFATGVSVPGVYGTKGTPAAGNIPGSRSSAVTWVDNNGNFWLFGGSGYDSANNQGFLNDLWEFNPSSNQWTWVTGSKTESSFSGQWGGLGTPAAGNTPGGRWQATSWSDNAGNLWLFGGEGFDSLEIFGAENDLWEFDISTSEWTWMGGSAIGGERGIYGTLGVASSNNIPGARTGALQWTDNQGHFWLLGGEGNDGNDVSALLNDLWEFNPTTSEWTWVAGTKDVPSNFIVPGVYGTPGVAAPGNVPGGRYESASWVDKTGNLWLLGGLANDSAGNFGNLNDVWEFEIASGSITPSVTVSPSSPSIVANQPLNVTISVSGGGSNPVPTGSVTLSSGSFSSAATTLSGGSATITIPANSLVVSTATLTANYTPDAASASTYGDATGSNTVMVTGNPAPTILMNGNGVEPVVIQAGVGGITLTVTGTGFVPASVVDFNGSPRATTYVSATELTAQILASDVATIGSWPITVVNPPPGGGTSNAVTFNASLFAQTLTPGSLTFTSAVGATSATQTATFANVGNIPYFPVVIGLSEAPPKAFSIVANTCPNDLLGGASCTISIAFTPPTAGTFTAALEFDNGAYGNNNSTTVTGYGLNAAVVVVPSPSSIAATENLAVTVFVAGSAGNPTPTGSVTLTSGSYTSAPTILSGGSAVILVPAGSLGNGTDTVTAKYTPDSASSSIYPSATGSNTVAVSAQAQSPLQWAWMSGSNTIGGSGGRAGVYGTLQTPSAANVPGARNTAVGWTNSSGNLWLFGGAGLDANGASGDLNDMWEFNPSTNQWTWLSGSSAFVLGYINGVTQNVPINSVFGMMGVPAAGNTPGGREGAVAWTDNSGNLWLFGGAGAEAEPFAGYEYTESPGQFNDLWEFNPSTNQWAWMGGSNLVNQSGVYGTPGTPAAGNVPGARANAVSWTDNNGNLWLFGGYGWDSAGTPGYLNDLWEYSLSTKQWTWIAGSNTSPLNTSDPAHDGAFGVYGTPGTAAAGNTPGARIGATAQTDHNGNLWMFGGTGLDANGTYGYLDDLWEFSPSTGLWTWVGGTKKVPGSTNSGQPGIYGTFGVPAALNDAGGRTGAVSWSDKNGNLWLMGGQGYDANDNLGSLNDVWAYQLPTDEGDWLGGSNALSCVTQICAGEPGEYGVLRTAAIGNTPGGRNGGVSWTDSSGRFWLFGGTGQDGNNASGLLNDLWSVAPAALAAGAPIAPTVTVTPSPSSITTAQGLTVTVTVSGTPTPTGSVTLTSGSYSSGAVALGNGSASINIPAGLLAAGTDALTANYTPDAASSSTYTNATGSNSVMVTAPALIMPTVTVTPGSASITTTQALSVTVAVSGGSGNPTPTGSVTLTSGTYSSGAVTLIGGSATINIAAGSLATGSETLTVAYTPDSLSASTYAGATGSSLVAVAAEANGAGWVWMDGGDSAGLSGVYGTLGTPAAVNIPGSRRDAVSWTDNSGHLWLFGGDGDDAGNSQGYLNDVWEFDPSSVEWTWMGGSNTNGPNLGQPGVYGTLGTPAAGNIPGGRFGAAGWTDKSGQFWLFGGLGIPPGVPPGNDGYPNDLWKFNPSTNQWAWMGGSNSVVLLAFGVEYGRPGVYGTLGTPAAGNTPGGREKASTWTDSSGNLWLFGGSGFDDTNNFGYLNDLWEFNPATNQWGWMGGSNSLTGVLGQPGVYGTLGTSAAGNTPGGRDEAVSWTDDSGNLWLFGGEGYDASGRFGLLNDLWEFNVSAKQWTWMGGNSTLGNNCSTINNRCGWPGVYGTLGTAASGNFPGGRTAAISWTDGSGNFWLYGGDGFGGDGNMGYLNDLWEFNPSSGQWAWINGSSTIPSSCLSDAFCGEPGVYGTKQTSAATNTPGGKASAPSWTDKSGNLWLFGGEGVTDCNGGSGLLNGLWRYSPSAANAPGTITPTLTVSPSSSSITTAQTLGVTITVAGPCGSPTPTGSVSLTSGSYTSAATPLSSGSATINIPAGTLAKGTDTLTATYAPDASSASTYTSATGSSAENVTAGSGAAPTVTITPSPASVTTAQALTVTVTVGGTPTPTGSVTLTSGTYSSGAVTLSGGSATINIPAGSLAVGTDTLTVTYTPDSASSATYTSATGSNTVTVTTPARITPTVTVTPSSASITTVQALSVTVTVGGGSGNPTPTGSVTLTSGSFTSAATTLSSGTATINISAGSLATGTDTLTVTYTPDANSSPTYNSATGSSSVTVTAAAAPSFTLSSPTAPQTVQAGGTAQYTITATAQNGTFSSAATLAASGLPTGAVATFSPVSVTPGSSSANSTLSIQTASTATALARPNSAWPLAAPALAVIGLCLVPGKRRRRWITLAVLLIASLGAFTALTACGGGFGYTAPSQSYTITVTGTSGTDEQTTTVQLTVQ